MKFWTLQRGGLISPVPEDGPQLSTKTHLQHHIQILVATKRLVQPDGKIDITLLNLILDHTPADIVVGKLH